jgi:hypothetical protein
MKQEDVMSLSKSKLILDEGLTGLGKSTMAESNL